MDGWALLVRPSANRVYAEATPGLLRAEAQILDDAVLGGRLRDVATTEIAGIPYLTFAADLGDEEVAHVARLSGLYAMFRRSGEALVPVPAAPLAALDDDLLTIQKYAGKTNELFTRLLLNVTLWASAAGPRVTEAGVRERPIRVLDPVCGRGTTLHQALLYGCDADGIDRDGRDLDAHAAFLKTWLRRKRLKHAAEVVPLRRSGRRLGRSLEVSIGVDRDAWKRGDVLRMRAAEADTVHAAEIYKSGRYDVVVGDLPYGVQHGAHAGADLDRGPLRLLDDALGGWVELLRTGGALGLAWNAHVAGRDEVVGRLAAGGLVPLDHGPWRDLSHRVDAGIHRDVVVARKTG